MNKHNSTARTFVMVALAMLARIGASRADDAATADEAARLAGTWQLVAAEVGGSKLPSEVTRKITLTLSADHYVVVAESKDEGTVRYIAGASPKAFDVTGTAGPNQGKTVPAIYELAGDTLTICYDLSGKARPTQLKSKPNTQLFLATYKRVKSPR
jgi:uncharacterized protein (TIGR03067 family)